MRILIIPDVHGRTFWKDVYHNIHKVDKVIFLGDYLDPYPDENISFEDALDNLKEIIKFKEIYKDQVISLLGNHDFHYIYDTYPCCRFNEKYAKEAKDLLNKLDLKVIYTFNNYLFSHAGVAPEWLNQCGLTIKDLKNPNIENIVYALEVIGYRRGGYNKIGSCIWCDIREFVNSSYKDLGYYQIFGHTQLKDSPYITKNLACLDCREFFVLNTDTGEIV